MTDFKEKYLKYKKKYLDLKSQIGGNFVELFLIDTILEIPKEEPEFYMAQKEFERIVGGKNFDKTQVYITYSTWQNKLIFKILKKGGELSEEYQILSLGKDALKADLFKDAGRHYKGAVYPIKIKTEKMEFILGFKLDSHFKIKASSENMDRKTNRNFSDDDGSIGKKILEDIKNYVNKHNTKLEVEKYSSRIGDKHLKRMKVTENYIEMIN